MKPYSFNKCKQLWKVSSKMFLEIHTFEAPCIWIEKKINSCNILVGIFREIILFARLYWDFNKKQEKNRCSYNLIFFKYFPSNWASKVSKLIPRQRITDDSAAAIQWSYKEQISEAHLERSQTSTLKLFWEIS